MTVSSCFIWQAYYKTDAARSNPKGSGLGLSIIKSIAYLHGFAAVQKTLNSEFASGLNTN